MKQLPAARKLTLDLLRTKTQAALAKLGQVNAEEALTILYRPQGGGEEVEISQSHLMNNTACAPGSYVVSIDGTEFRAEGVLVDPSSTPASEKHGSDIGAAVGRVVSSLLASAESSVENSARREKDAQAELDAVRARCAQAEQTVSALLVRNQALESGNGSDKTLKELQETLMLLFQQWVGGGQWTTDKVRKVVRLVDIVRASPRVQTLLQEEGGADVVRALIGA